MPAVGPEGLTLHSVFFLDTSRGWVVISHDERVAAPTFQEFIRPKTVYGIARTRDGGQTWSLAPLTYPELPEWEQQALGRPDDLFFLDPTHGWMVMLMVGSSNFAPGKLLATTDGGVSWNWVNSPGTIGTLLFTSTQDGWLAGGPGGQRLYVTHDACKSWEEVALTPAPQVSAPSNPVVEGAPVFGDGGQGFVAVAYEGREGAGSKLVAYATEDGGKTWKPRKILPESKLGAEFSVSIVGSSIVVPTALDKAGVSVAVVPLTGGLTSGVVVSRTGVSDLSFADASDGLALTRDGRVQYTWDGGATWRDITPWHLRTTPGPAPISAVPSAAPTRGISEHRVAPSQPVARRWHAMVHL